LILNLCLCIGTDITIILEKSLNKCGLKPIIKRKESSQPSLLNREKQLKIYISGPISGATNYPSSFKDAADYLRDLGYDIVDPSTIAAPSKDTKWTTWDYYMREGIKRLMDCDRIYMLEGWEDSEGARLEQMIAKQLHLPCLYEVEDIQRV